ncbi:hypothetical protein FF100_21575 [Methylobacterium terricola]|uniref:Uncharacterized protein n=1 Tax=Methylobacterium terricola TaxID=2583531 RepID=A0A5C4LCL7_9HYPH|nr:hypothetical protein [Methylobacterium terricola]TNC10750.1 hypothetical protein FF100_21575 [Methylobacterium terricola]
MRLLHPSTGLAAALALALRADLAALALLAAWAGSALLGRQRAGAGEGPWIRAALALALVWRAPGGPAAALVAALLLEMAAGRLTILLAARTGTALPGPDLHSLILAGGKGADLVAAAAFAAMILWPDRLAPIASALAGLTAMGAIARASLALAVTRGVRDEA